MSDIREQAVGGGISVGGKCLQMAPGIPQNLFIAQGPQDTIQAVRWGMAAVGMDGVGTDVLINYTVGWVVVQFLNPAMKHYHKVGEQ